MKDGHLSGEMLKMQTGKADNNIPLLFKITSEHSIPHNLQIYTVTMILHLEQIGFVNSM